MKLMRKSLVLAGLVAASLVATTQIANASFTVTEKECTGEGVPTLCIELSGKLFEAKGEETYAGKLIAGTHITFTIKTVPVAQVITCTEDVSRGVVSQPNPGTQSPVAFGTLELKGCELTTEPKKKCVINLTNVTKELEGTIIDAMPVSAGIVLPRTGTVLVEVAYSNNGAETCPATYKGYTPSLGPMSAFHPTPKPIWSSIPENASKMAATWNSSAPKPFLNA